MKTLPTDRLVIRPMTIDDAGFMLALLNEPAWLRYIGDRGIRTIADAEAYIQKTALDMYGRLGYGFCMVEAADSGRELGICGLAKRDYLDCADIGFAFRSQEWGHGYAHEAAAAVLRYATGELAMPRVLATTRLDNFASQRVLEKLDMRFERTIAHPDGDRELRLYATSQLAPGSTCVRS